LAKEGEVEFMLETAAVVECFLVLGLDGGDAGFVVLTAGFEVLVYLVYFGFCGFSAPKLDF
jgi:hypothetical protein